MTMPRHSGELRAAVTEMAREYVARPGNGAGGSLHIVLDDDNLEDSHVRWCAEYAREQGDEAGVRLAEAMLRLSRTQRGRVAKDCHR